MLLTKLSEIAMARGRNEKKQQLKNCTEDIWRVLYLTYNPYIRFHTTLRGIKSKGHESLDLSVVEHLRGAALEAYARKLESRDLTVLQRIVRKDARIGIGAATINQVRPGFIPIHAVMLAKEFEKHRLKYPCVVTTKLDGLRALYVQGRFYTRNGKIITGVEHLEKLLEGAPTLDGELVVINEDFYTASGLLRNKSKTKNAQFWIFDMPNHSSPYLLDRLTDCDIFLHKEHIKLTPFITATSYKDIKEFYDAQLVAGFEGVVIKSHKYKYVSKRSFHWMKLKPELTIDAEIIGVFEGTGRNEGRLGGLVCIYNDVEFKVGTGFSDSLRDRFWADPPIGYTAEIKCQEITPKGSLRHPRFLRMRVDK